MSNSVAKQRNIGIELLRIVSMLMVVGLHYFTFGEAVYNANGTNLYISRFLYALCYCAVNIFMLITGYFGIRGGGGGSIRKVLSLWLQTAFYSVGIWLLCLIARPEKALSAKSILSAFAPVTMEQNWYVSAYIVMLLIAPFLNKLIDALDNRQHTALSALIILTVTVPACVLPSKYLLDESIGYSVFWFICLYLFGAWLKKYEPLKKIKTVWISACGFLMISGIFASAVILHQLHLRLGIEDYWALLYRYTCFPVVITAICFFEVFRRIKIQNSICTKIITWISPLTLAVLLIHNHNLLRSPLFNTIFGCKNYYDSPFMILHFLGTVLAIFTVCIAIEALRRKLLNNLNSRIATAISCRAQKISDKLFSYYIKFNNEK